MSRVSLRHAPENDNPKEPIEEKSKTNLMSMKRKAPTTMTKKMRMKKRMMISRAVLSMPALSLLSHLYQALILTYLTQSLKKRANVSEEESRDKRRKGVLVKSHKLKKVLI